MIFNRNSLYIELKATGDLSEFQRMLNTNLLSQYRYETDCQINCTHYTNSLVSHGILVCPLCCLIIMCLYCSVVLVYLSFFIIIFFSFFFNCNFQPNLFSARGKKDYLQSTWDCSEKLSILWTNIIFYNMCAY